MKIPAPGKLINVGSRRLHVLEQGEGSPAVVLEAGIAASSISWCLVQTRVAEITRVVSYDRAGFGWSDAAERGGTALEAAEDLAALIKTPSVLVGHSFGGLVVRLFQQLHPELVAGLVLVDPVLRSEWRAPGEARKKMLARGVMLSRRGAWLARAGVVGLALRMLTGGSQRIPRILARASAGSGAGVTDRLVGEVRKMPPELWPAIAGHWSEARSFNAMASNLEHLPVSVTQLDEDRRLGDLPMIVLSAGGAKAEHAHDAALSTRGEHIVVPDSGHWMQLDAPEIVIEAISRVVAQVRAR